MDLVASYRAFVRLAERGSFSAVARELGQSQPTVSRRLSELEEHLGTRLIARTTRTFSLTAEGQEFLDKARQVLRALDDAEHAVGARAQSLSGRLRILAPVSLGRIFLVPRLSKFMARHHGIDVDLVLSENPGNLHREGIDLALSVGYSDRLADRSGKLGEVPMVLCGSPGLIRDAGTPRNVEALSSLPAVVPIRADLANDIWRLERGIEIREVVPQARFRSDSSEAMLAAMIEGLGIGLAPLWLVQEAIEQGRLWRLLPQWRGGVLPVHIAYPEGRTPNARARALIEFLTASVKGDKLFV